MNDRKRRSICVTRSFSIVLTEKVVKNLYMQNSVKRCGIIMKSCQDCEYFQCCSESQDLGGICSTDKSVLGICKLWDGVKRDLKVCTSFTPEKNPHLSCLSCTYFHNCSTDGEDAQSYCSLDRDVVGICTLWNGPKKDTAGCNGYSSK